MTRQNAGRGFIKFGREPEWVIVDAKRIRSSGIRARADPLDFCSGRPSTLGIHGGQQSVPKTYDCLRRFSSPHFTRIS
jgi:hypothetical protein